MRQANGRFAEGNPGGPGRPRRETEAAYLRTLRDAVSLESWRAICERAAADAMAGDHRAREWLARYVMPAAPDDMDPAPEAERLDLTSEALDAILAQAKVQRTLHEAAGRDYRSPGSVAKCSDGAKAGCP